MSDARMNWRWDYVENRINWARSEMIRRRRHERRLRLSEDEARIKSRAKRDPDGASQKPLPFHLTLLGLPREIRDLIFSFVFQDNGIPYVHAQLRDLQGAPPLSFTANLKILSTCYQLNEEYFSMAYQSTCFYNFWCHRHLVWHLGRTITPRQLENIRHVAIWSNPYWLCPMLDHIPPSLRLKKLTVFCNYMCLSGPEPDDPDVLFLDRRVRWIFNLAKKLKYLEEFDHLTGCAATFYSREEMFQLDLHMAGDLRAQIRYAQRYAPFWTRSVDVFWNDTSATRMSPHFELHVPGIEPNVKRKVHLVVASIYELDEQAEESRAVPTQEGLETGETKNADGVEVLTSRVAEVALSVDQAIAG